MFIQDSVGLFSVLPWWVALIITIAIIALVVFLVLFFKNKTKNIDDHYKSNKSNQDGLFSLNKRIKKKQPKNKENQPKNDPKEDKSDSE